MVQKTRLNIEPLLELVESDPAYTAKSEFNSALDSYDSFRLSLQALDSQLETLLSDLPYGVANIESIEEAAETMRTRIAEYLGDPVGPENVDAGSGTARGVSDLCAVVSKWTVNNSIGNNSTKDTENLLAAISSLQLVKAPSGTSELLTAVKSMYSDVYLRWEQVKKSIRKNCDVTGGECTNALAQRQVGH